MAKANGEGTYLDKNGTNNGRVILQPRDRKLLEVLSNVRFLDRWQAAELAGFTSATRAKARLLGLTRSGYLSRFFVGTIAGGRKAVYHLPSTRRERRQSKLLASVRTEQFAEHELALSGLYLALRAVGRSVGMRWQRITEGLPDRAGVVPDAYFELEGAAQEEKLGFFLEVDLGTESAPVWDRKVRGYLKFAQSGAFQARFGLPAFRVLVVARGEDRINAIRSMIAKRTDKVFWLATTETINCEGLWSAIWLRPRGEQRHALL